MRNKKENSQWERGTQEAKAQQMLRTTPLAPAESADISFLQPMEVPTFPESMWDEEYQRPTGEGTDAVLTNLFANQRAKDKRERAEQERFLRIVREPYLPILEVTEKQNPVEFLNTFHRLIDFEEHDKGRKLRDETIEFEVRLATGEVEDYDTKRQRTEQRTQKDEAASYGIGTINGNRFVLFATHFDYMGGSIGIIAGQKMVEAAALAAKEGVPLTAIYSTGGIRQHEGNLGLWQMPEVVRAVTDFQKRTKQPYIAVANRSFGGASASGLPLGISGGIKGDESGFTGRNVIEKYTGTMPDNEFQRVEGHVYNRELDMLWHSPEDLRDWLDATMEITRNDMPHGQQRGHEEKRPLTRADRFPFGGKTFFTPLHTFQQITGRDPSEEEKQVLTGKPAAGDIVHNTYDRFKALRRAERPDPEYFMRQCFDKFVPLYSSFVDENRIHNPAIGYGLAEIDDPRIGRRRYVVIGNLAGYQLSSTGEVRMIPSNPEPHDYYAEIRAYELAEQLGYDVINFVNTPGAKPTPDSEKQGISRAIATMTKKALACKQEVDTYIIGEGASGGMIGMGAVRSIKMLRDALAYVAEPLSSAAILYKDPTEEDVMHTLLNLQPTAEEMLKAGLIEGIIPVPRGGAVENPEVVAHHIREDIIQTIMERHGVHPLARARSLVRKQRQRWRREHHN